MSDWNPQVVVIEKVEAHPDADALDIATVLGDYPVIIKRGEYKAGDLAGYIPIDSIVPDTEQFYFLCPKSYEKYEDDNGNLKQRQTGSKFPVGQVPEKSRIIKAKQLRGIYSQGMLVAIPPMTLEEREPGDVIDFVKVGDSIVELVGLKKWEEEEEENLPNVKRRGANAASPPKGWTIPHYDIVNVRKYLACLKEDEQVVLTEKIHGSNAGFSHDGEQLWVKSRNWYLKKDEDDMWWDIANRYDLENKLKAYPGLVMFGEVYGHLPKFRYDTALETKIRFFDIFDTKTKRYLDYDDRIKILTEAGLDTVPELFRGVWSNKDEMYQFAEGQSTLNTKHIREGAVINTVKERFEPRLNSRLQLKIIGQGYNLQK